MSTDEALYQVKSLGPCEIENPFKLPGIHFIDDSERIIDTPLYQNLKQNFESHQFIPSFERAGPRKNIYFDPEHTTACIVTCGGLCPGLNDVVQTVVMTLYNHYGVKRILGARYGYEGLIESYHHGFVELTPENVNGINEHGGTILGSSRGMQSVEDTVSTLFRHQIDILFVIGGDGTQRGGHDLVEEIEKRNLKIAVVGIPKTIDNDIEYVDQTFGFMTAVHAARMSIMSGHEEAEGARNGVAIVKLMGRDSGFIAAYSSVANTVVNFCLIPEVPFALNGKGGLLEQLEKRLKRKKHALIVVAEGAGQHLFKEEPTARDKSGNVKYSDIGLFLKKKIGNYFKDKGMEVPIKYIDPSYSIRSVPTNSYDSILCVEFGMMAVHAAMAGKTDCIVGSKHRYPVHVPVQLLHGKRKMLDLKRSVYQALVSTTTHVVNFQNKDKS